MIHQQHARFLCSLPRRVSRTAYAFSLLLICLQNSSYAQTKPERVYNKELDIEQSLPILTFIRQNFKEKEKYHIEDC